MNKDDLRKWQRENGDNTYRLNYDLDENSTVFDVGGFKGDFTYKIYNKFNCNIYVFEPVKSFYENLINRFGDNNKIKIFNFGLGSKTENLNIHVDGDATSTYTQNGTLEEIKIVNIIDFIKKEKVDNIDLLKLNIEGEEFPLLEKLIKSKELNKINNIQVQFHEFMENSKKRRKNIRKKLSNYFINEWSFEFVWESWKKI